MFGFLPLRQKITITITLLLALGLFICSYFLLLPIDTLNKMATYFSIGLPLFLLMQDTLVDLNKPGIFLTWFAMSIVMLIIAIILTGSETYYDYFHLRTLFIFLCMYWAVNKVFNRKGIYVINAFRHFTPYHDIAQRRIGTIDIIVNLVLGMAIVLSNLI